MSEYLRDVTVRIIVDTNKQTDERYFALASYDSLSDLLADVRDVLTALEEDA